ncbi:MAG: hypothetical protein AB8D78_02595 [Akkermansiaceae bacterium]
MALWSVAGAQNSEGPSLPDRKKSGRQAWIVATSLPDDVKSPVTVLAGGELSEVRLSKRSVGTSIKVPKDGVIQVVKPSLSEDGKTTYEILVSVMIPEGIKKSLIILAPVPNLKPPLKFRARIVDLDKFRGGNALIVNNTNLEIGVVLGAKKATLGTGQIQIMDVGEFSGSKNVTVSYHFRLPKQEKWNLISASTVPLRSSFREILIFSYNADLGQADYHGITFPVED